MATRAKFTRTQLRAASLELIDSKGLRGFSMRSLASKLGTAPMTIYNYVRNRDELEALVTDAVVAEVRWPRSAGDWKHDVRAIMTALWRVFYRHPNVIPLLLTRQGKDEEAFAPVEALLNALARSGRSGKRLLVAFDTVSGFLFGLVQRHLAGPLLPAQEAPSPAKFPCMVQMKDLLNQIDPDYEFRCGLDIILAGLAAG